MDLQAAINHVIEGRDLSPQAMTKVMRGIMQGEATPAQMGGVLVGLRMKGETVDEITAAAQVMRELAVPVEVATTHLIDTCGTGGDGIQTFNISTTAAFVAAAAGARVAKHGNRSVSSRSGSADVLQAAGVALELSPEQIAQCIDSVGVGFLFAPAHHGAMKHASGPRRELGTRTLFNLLGPLCNPARAPAQLLGIYSRRWLEPMVQVLKRLGGERAMVVHAEDGMDEISIGAATRVAELKDGSVVSYTLTPEQFGFARADLGAIRARDAADSLRLMQAVLRGEPSPARDIVVLNAGASIYLAGCSETLAEGMARAKDALRSGKALATLQAFSALTQQLEKGSA
jgi:anthranilate phosphoribosyltransferase